ncbi:MAG: hypothetical protein GF308_20725 [Candidatus Heimdallarchaeota archaeon]|nr:hypothetical protein [Candidatus Heimdallarchaeota archaeon]
MKNKKILFGIVLVSFFLLPAIAQTKAENEQIGVGEDQGTITITTEKITFKIVGGKPHFIWWNGNQSTADEMYKVHFTSISEFFGDDEVLDSKDELNGISYNLMGNDWDYEIVEEETEVTITLILTGLANDVEIQFVIHIYSEDHTVSGTNQTVTALSEVKIDIVVDNWVFSENAQGLAFKSSLFENQQRHRVRVRNRTGEEQGNNTRAMIFESEEQGGDVAYYEWATTADVYNGTDKISTVDVRTAYFEGPSQGPPGNITIPGDVTPLSHLWLTYPNYGDSYKLVHDPSIGVYEEAFSSGVPLYILPVLAAFFASGLFVLFLKRRK